MVWRGRTDPVCAFILFFCVVSEIDDLMGSASPLIFSALHLRIVLTLGLNGYRSIPYTFFTVARLYEDCVQMKLVSFNPMFLNKISSSLESHQVTKQSTSVNFNLCMNTNVLWMRLKQFRAYNN